VIYLKNIKLIEPKLDIYDKWISSNQMNYFNTFYVKVYNMLHYIIVELLSNCLKIFVFQIFHYFSGPTAKKDQPSTTMDTMKDN